MEFFFASEILQGDDDTLMMELDDTLFYNEKMDFEVELIPMKSIFERINIPHFLLNHHYIRSKGDTTCMIFFW